jgi:hypothetical protein
MADIYDGSTGPSNVLNPKFKALGKPMDDKRLHHFMVAAQVVYQQDVEVDGKMQTETGVRMLNCMVITGRPVFGMAQIGQAHMGVQHNFASKLKGTAYRVIDITIMSLMDLGRFTPEEFQEIPQPK